MKTFIINLIIFAFATSVYSQSIYIKTFGNKESSPVIFLYGGPGYNCANFEATTAKALSEQEYFVIFMIAEAKAVRLAITQFSILRNFYRLKQYIQTVPY